MESGLSVHPHILSCTECFWCGFADSSSPRADAGWAPAKIPGSVLRGIMSRFGIVWVARHATE